MLELQKKIEEYYRVMDELVDRALENKITVDHKDWRKLDELKQQVKELAILI